MRALAKVVQQQGRQHQAEPGIANRLAAKVAHIGVQRLGAGQRQHHRAQRQQAGPAMVGQKAQAQHRIDRLQHGRLFADAQHAQRAQGEKPQPHDRAKKRPHLGSAAFLNQKQRNQHAQRQRQHIGVQLGRHHLQPFDRRQHRNGRGDHHLAKEQARAQQAKHQHQRARQAFQLAASQRRQGEDAAFAFIVGAQHKRNVFQGDHHDDRPENQRQDAGDVGDGGGQVGVGAEAFFQRVQRTGANIAVDNAKSGKGQRRQRRFVAGSRGHGKRQ